MVVSAPCYHHAARPSATVLHSAGHRVGAGAGPRQENPPYEGEVDYGDRAEHCWNGDHTRPNAISRLRYAQMFAPKIVQRILKSAPRGADLKSWRY